MADLAERRACRAWAFAPVVLLPRAALANAGLPMLMVAWPLSIAALLPVIALEGWIVHRALRIPWLHAAGYMSLANLFSTFIGVPMTWGLLVAVQFGAGPWFEAFARHADYLPPALLEAGQIVLSAPWLMPNPEPWVFSVSMMLLLVPFFWASYWAEAWSVSKLLAPDNPRTARKAIWRANIASYTGLLAFCAAWSLWAWARRT